MVTWSPRGPLAGWIRSIDVVSAPGAGGRERVGPRGTVTLVGNLAEDEFRPYGDLAGGAVARTSGAVVSGPQSAARIVDGDTRRRLLRVALAPGAAAAFLPVPAAELADTGVAL